MQVVKNDFSNARKAESLSLQNASCKKKKSRSGRTQGKTG